MAKIQTQHRRLLHLLSFLLLLSYVSTVLSRTTHHSRSRTASLDVSTSLNAAARAISFDGRRRDSHAQQMQDTTGKSTLSLQVHSRDFLPTVTHGHSDYESLTLARLHRDTARVEALTARVALAVNGVKRSDLKPMVAKEEVSLSAEAIRGPIVSGTSQGSGEYFSPVGIGSPAKMQYMVLDTGSDVTWVQCQPCSDCYQQSDPIYDPSSSASYSQLPCNSDQCHALDVSACRNSSCLYQVSYGDGSFTVGDFASETLTFGDSAPVTRVAFGCGHDNEGLFVGSAGILGLGGGALSFPSQIDAKSFSYCLVDRDSPTTSTLEFGKDSADNGEAEGVTAPLLRNGKLDTFYYMGMSGISVGGEMLSIPPSAFAMDERGGGGVIVDSGTAVTRLQSGAYAALRDAFGKGMTGLPKAAGVALFDTCYDLSSRTSVEVPTVAFHFPGGGEMRLPAKNYLIPVSSAGTFCLAFAPTSSPLSIVGNVQQQGTRVSIDSDRAVVGFAVNKC